jgi:hypothetical protein
MIFLYVNAQPCWLGVSLANLPCIASGNPKFFFPPHLCRWLFRFCWLGAPLANSACLWVPLFPTCLALPLETPIFPCIGHFIGRCLFRFCWLGAPLAFGHPSCLALPLETPSFFPTTPVSLAISVMLVGCSSCQLGLPLDAPLANLPCIASGNPKFVLHSGNAKFFFPPHLCGCLFRFCWLGVSLANLPCIASGNPKFFFPPHLCRWLFRFCWLGAPLANSACLWVPLFPTCLALPLETPIFPCIRETPSFSPTTPVSLALRFSWLGAPLANFRLILNFGPFSKTKLI